MSNLEIFFAVAISILTMWNMSLALRLHFCKTICTILLRDSEELQKQYFLETHTPFVNSKR